MEPLYIYILPIVIYGEEAWTLQSQEIQSVEVLEMRCLQAIRGVTRVDRLQNIEIREDTFTSEPINRCHQTQVVLACLLYAKR